MLSTLFHPATLLFQAVPLLSWTGKQCAATKSCRSFVSFAEKCIAAVDQLRLYVAPA